MNAVDKRPFGRMREAEYLMDNHDSNALLCRHCQKEITIVGQNLEPDKAGAWSNEFHCFLHVKCHRKIERHREEHNKEKIELIKQEVAEALNDKTAMTQNYYNIFEENSHRHCTYCEGILTNVRLGILYPRASGLEKELDDERDFYGNVAVHIDCYNSIRASYKTNLDIEEEVKTDKRTHHYKLFKLKQKKLKKRKAEAEALVAEEEEKKKKAKTA